jgi:mannose-1-phosphate guanylyltransferase
MKAVILAGGKGKRLRPYTLVLPKPLMPVGDQPVIEMLLKWLRRNGVREVIITIGYLGHLIRSLCKDGSQWGVDITYSEEKEPLGTVGPLFPLRDQLDETFLVLNGDLITDLNLRSLACCHRENNGILTVAITEKKIKLELGVIENWNGCIKDFKEKPETVFQVSMGIYCMEPDVLDLIPRGVPFGFDNLVYVMLEGSMPIYVYHHKGYWMDIGIEEDFLHAQEVVMNNRTRILGY